MVLSSYGTVSQYDVREDNIAILAASAWWKQVTKDKKSPKEMLDMFDFAAYAHRSIWPIICVVSASDVALARRNYSEPEVFVAWWGLYLP